MRANATCNLTTVTLTQDVAYILIRFLCNIGNRAYIFRVWLRLPTPAKSFFRLWLRLPVKTFDSFDSHSATLDEIHLKQSSLMYIREPRVYGIMLYFCKTDTLHKLRTRQNLACKFAIPRYSTSRLQRSIKYGGIKIWNSISSETRNSSFKVFKKKYKQCLLALY